MTTNTDNEQAEPKPVERVWVTHYLDGEVSDYWQTAPRKFDPERDSKRFVSVEYAPVSASSAAPTLCPNCGGSGEIEIGCAISQALTAPCVECGGTGIASPARIAEVATAGERTTTGDAAERFKWIKERAEAAAASPASTQEDAEQVPEP